MTGGRPPRDYVIIAPMTASAALSAFDDRRPFLGVARSATGKVWRDRLDVAARRRALAITQRHQVPEMLRACSPGAASRSTQLDFSIPPVRKLMPDPFTLTDIQVVTKRMADAAIGSERVAIFGDYDVDGATSAALLAWHLRHAGLDPLIHIPDRLFEGYGPNVEAVRMLAAKGATLLITVDCGTTSVEPLAEAELRP